MRRESTQHVINLVVTCTNRKRSTAHPALQARNLRGRTMELRIASWTQKLSAAREGAMPASEVYQGDHWSVVKSIGSLKTKAEVNIWIASAGYGLISPISEILPYAATLSARHEDSVAQNSAERRAWWTGMTLVPPAASPKTLRSLREVARKFKNSPLIIAASPEYIDAMTNDILAARKQLENPGLLSVLCRKDSAPAELSDISIPLRADFSTTLGGALTSLNARVLRWLIGKKAGTLTSAAVSRLLGGLALESKPRNVPKRARLTDSEVRQHIQSAIGQTGAISRSALLRTARESGIAVEQRRFGRIYDEVVGEAKVG